MKTILELVDEALEQLSQKEHAVTRGDISKAEKTLRTARLHLSAQPLQRAVRLLYEEMDRWATFKEGHIRVEVIVDLLRQEGLLNEDVDEGEKVGREDSVLSADSEPG